MDNGTVTKKAASKSQNGTRENNFSIIRLTATVFVFAGHMGVILGMQPPLLGGFPLHETGVMMLFLISGYLITMSWLSDPHPLRYGIRRFFRLWPPFAVMILIMVFLAAPLVSDLGVQGYFQSSYKAYLRNLQFFITYSQPGVFADLPVANTTNGSLWTMPVEAALYVLTPLILTVVRVKGRSKLSFCVMMFLTGAAVLTDFFLRVFCSGMGIVIYGTDLLPAYHLMVMYFIGMLFTYEEARKCLNLQVGCAVMPLLLFCQVLSGPVQYLVFYAVFPYFIFSFVFAPKPVFKSFGRKMDLSYGIYLYGFFFQQLMVSLQLQNSVPLSYFKTFLASLLPTLAAAFLSWNLVEKPVLRFSRRLTGK